MRSCAWSQPPYELIELSLLSNPDFQDVLHRLSGLSAGVPASSVAREVLRLVPKESQNQKVITEETLANYLFSRIPDIAVRFVEETDDWDLIISAYFWLAWVVRPHVEGLIEAGDENEAQRIFDCLECLANTGDARVKNELSVALEEMDTWRVWKFLGPTMQAAKFEEIVWFPVRRIVKHLQTSTSTRGSIRSDGAGKSKASGAFRI